MTTKRRSLTTRIRVSDRIIRQGGAVPVTYQHAGPMVVWHRRGCRCRLLRVFLSPEGWTLLAEDFRVKPDDWLRRIDAVDEAGNPREVDGVPVTVEARDEGQLWLANLRQVQGIERQYPLDVDSWPDPLAHFEVGCDDETSDALLSDVADDCRQAIRTGRVVSRDVGA